MIFGEVIAYYVQNLCQNAETYLLKIHKQAQEIKINGAQPVHLMLTSWGLNLAIT